MWPCHFLFKFRGLTKFLYLAQGFARVLKGMMLAASLSNMKEKVRQLQEGQQQAEDSEAKYERHCEKLKEKEN